MTAADLPWLALVAGLALLAWACRLLALDAREGFEVTMGGAMLFSQVWMLGATSSAYGVVSLLNWPWWTGIIAFVALMMLKSFVCRIIVALFLGTAMKSTPKQGGFEEFSKRSKEIEDSRKNGS